jgi:hypothetical protein
VEGDIHAIKCRPSKKPTCMKQCCFPRVKHLPWSPHEAQQNPRVATLHAQTSPVKHGTLDGLPPYRHLSRMTQAPRQFVVHRQATKPKQSRSIISQKLSLINKVSREATACLGKCKATLSHITIVWCLLRWFYFVCSHTNT